MKRFKREITASIVDDNHCDDSCLLLQGGYCIAKGKSVDDRIDLKLDGNTETYRRTLDCKLDEKIEIR
jgi:hypothetical protein